MAPLDDVLHASVSSLGSTESTGILNNSATTTGTNSETSGNGTDRHSVTRGNINNSSSNSNNNYRRRKRYRKGVAFDSTVVVQETLHSRDYTKEEHAASWMTKGDFERIDDNVFRALHLLEGGRNEQRRRRPSTIDNTDEICFRGLHEKTKIAVKQYGTKRRELLGAIFQEQSRQRKKGFIDAETIALVSSLKTFESQQAALQRGLQDECDARDPMFLVPVYASKKSLVAGISFQDQIPPNASLNQC